MNNYDNKTLLLLLKYLQAVHDSLLNDYKKEVDNNLLLKKDIIYLKNQIKILEGNKNE